MPAGVQQRGSSTNRSRVRRLSDESAHTSGDEVYYVQVRYPRADRWITLACARERRVAARRAALVFPEVVNTRGEHAMQVRVIRGAQLAAEDDIPEVARLPQR
jgi:hypothetical protein